MPSKTRKKILVVEDELIIQKLCARVLEQSDYQVKYAKGLKDGFEELESSMPDLLISDLKLPDGDGMDIIRLFKERNNGAAVLIITGSIDYRARLEEAKQFGVHDLLAKPFEMEDFTGIVDRLLMK